MTALEMAPLLVAATGHENLFTRGWPSAAAIVPRFYILDSAALWMKALRIIKHYSGPLLLTSSAHRTPDRNSSYIYVPVLLSQP